MATRNARTARNAKTPQAPVAPAPIRPTASPATPSKPVLGEHLQRALDVKKQRDVEKAAAAQQASSAAPPVTPAAPLIMTPSTPVPAATASDICAELEKRVVKAQSEINSITAWLTKERMGSRVAELESRANMFDSGLQNACITVTDSKETIVAMSALVQSQQGIIDNVLGALDSMTTRMQDIETAVATWLVSGAPVAELAPVKAIDVFDVLGYAYETMIETPVAAPAWGAELDAPVAPPARNGTIPPVVPPAAPRAPKAPQPTRTIPARGTGAMADHAHLVPQIREMVDAGFSQKDIAVHFNICGEDGKPSGKVVWHLLNRNK